MKKNIKHLAYFLCGVVAVIAISCAKEAAPAEEPVEPSGNPADTEIPEGYVAITFTAVCDGGTKSALDGDDTVWSENDQIKVFFDGGDPQIFTLSSDAGEKSGLFSGIAQVGATPLYAVYPASITSAISGTGVNITVPGTQDGSFGSGNIAVAKVGEENNMAFKNVAALLSFQLKTGTNVSKIEVRSVDNSSLSGVLTVDCSGDIPTPTAASSGSSLVTMTISGARTYYMAVLPVSSISKDVTHTKGLDIRYFSGTSGSYKETGCYYLKKNLSIEKNNIYSLGEVETDKNYYVTVGGKGDKNGMNWDNALSKDKMWKMLQLGGTDVDVDAAKVRAVDGATFHLGAGTYYFGTDPTISFSESSPISITFKGDYPSGGAASQTRDGANRAVFSGTNPSNASEKGAAIKLRGKVNITFDGISFENGYGTADESEDGVSAALDCYSSGSDGADISVTMNYCCVKNNTNAYYNTSTNKWGAGVRLMNVSSFHADSVTFAHNTSRAAPALSVRNTSVTLENCEFIDNKSSFDCGALYVNGSSASASITDCTFTDNEAINEEGAGANKDYGKGLGGAIKCVDGGTLTITGGAFSNNKAWKGGAIYVKNSSSVKTLHAIGTTFTGNGSGNTRSGGAIFTEASFTIDDCTFSYNNAACWGGAIEMEASKNYYVRGGTFSHNAISTRDPDYGGGAMCLGIGTLQMNKGTNGLSFTGNTSAGMGGALFLESNTSFTDASFSSNSSDLDGGAIYVKSGTATIHDASFTGNHARYGGSMLISSNAEIYKTQFDSNYAWGSGALYINQSSSGKHAWFDRCSFSGNYITDPNNEESGTTLYLGAITEFCMNNCSINDNTYTISTHTNYSRPAWVAIIGAEKSMFSNCSFIGNLRRGSNGSTTVSSGASMIHIEKGLSNCYFINSIVACNNGASDQAGNQSFRSWGTGATVASCYYVFRSDRHNSVTVTSTTGGQQGEMSNTDVGDASWSSNCWSWNGKIKGADVSKATAGNILSQMNTVSSSFVSWLGSDKYLDGRSVKRGSGKDTDEWWPGAYQN